jgi:MFS transporter, FHS family, L-fucose permease
VQGPYLVIAFIVLTWAVLVAITRFPKAASSHVETASSPSLSDSVRRLLGNRHYVSGVFAQFCYVGAQVGIWSFLIRYTQHELPGVGEKTAATYLTWSLVAFMVGRFVGTALMGRFNAARLMGFYAVANVVLTLVAILAGGQLGLLALASTSFFMSIMFPTIFANAIRDVGELRQLASSFLVMSIIGGAVLTALMGWISDMTSIRAAMLVPLLCCASVAAFGLTKRYQVRQSSLGRDVIAEKI